MDDQTPATSADREHRLITMRLLVTIAVIVILGFWIKIWQPYDVECMLGVMVALCAAIGCWGSSHGPIIGAAVGAAFLPAIVAVLSLICIVVEKINSIFH